ncbi:hypothetical protein CISIN_1g032012mg [Citrus sinensis]|uniref:Legume lectin domain-containing protein n=1 Tax=Citrus sinensis TaxID=2711 RepID=A0A067DAQ0_CITSI|nr:hypothetical protein CISIN_1g032012mg [Citrus sinensis]
MPFSSYLSKFPLYLPRPHGSRFESDVYVNSWDPTISKLLVSISTLCNQRKMYLLRSDVKSGRRNEAWISYNSSTHNPSVAFTGFRNNSVVMQGLGYQVDLRQHLPEFVTFGFSMETRVDFVIFSIYSWEFNSSLEMDDETTNHVSNPKR